jgi:putative ABC transport system permease protein
VKRDSLRPGIRRLIGLDVPRASKLVRDLEDELRFHIERRTAQLIDTGLSPLEAEQRARAQYGSIDAATSDIRHFAKRRHHRMTTRHFVDSVLQDLRFALRTLRRQPGWTAITITALALGIGANSAVFSVVNDLLIDPLRYPYADRVVLISRTDGKGLRVNATLENYKAWSKAQAFASMHAIATNEVTETGFGDPRLLQAARTDAQFFAFAGARVVAGRSLRDDEAAAPGAPVAIISEQLAYGRFNGLRNAIGMTMTIDGRIVTVVGVVRDGLRLPSYTGDPPDIWLPFSASTSFLNTPLVARLRVGTTIAAAQAELDAIAKADNANRSTLLSIPLTPMVYAPGSSGDVRRSVLMLAGAVALLLLIACANVAHLMLARGAAREREIAVRAAIGAGRSRIARQLVTESLLLALAGCVAGLAVALGGLRLIIAMRPQSMGALRSVSIDGRVLAATIALSVLTGLVFGVLSAVDALRSRQFAALRMAGDASTDRRRHLLRSLLVVSEMALSVILLVGAALLVRTMINLHRVDPGFDAAGLFAVSVPLPESRYPSEIERAAYGERLLAATRELPGVASATIASGSPLIADLIVSNWQAEGETPPTGDGPLELTAALSVNRDYFPVVAVPFVEGSAFDEGSADRNEAVINEDLAMRLWHERHVVGRRFRPFRRTGQTPAPWFTVRGVVKDAAMLSLVEDHRTAVVYTTSHHIAGFSRVTLLARMRSGHSPAAAMRAVQLALDPTLPPEAPRSVSEMLMNTVARQRFIMTLLTAFAGIAVCLSAIGLYGVIAYMVRQRTHEIGVRIALGAESQDIVRLVVSQGVVLAISGLSIGVVGAAAGARVLSGTLYGVTSGDPLSYVGGGAALLVVAAVACFAPARRAARIDPVVAMRAD